VQTKAGGRNWANSQVGMWLNVIRIDGSDSECYTFVVRLERLKPQIFAKKDTGR
jgi:hypothetical protein